MCSIEIKNLYMDRKNNFFKFTLFSPTILNIHCEMVLHLLLFYIFLSEILYYFKSLLLVQGRFFISYYYLCRAKQVLDSLQKYHIHILNDFNLKCYHPSSFTLYTIFLFKSISVTSIRCHVKGQIRKNIFISIIILFLLDDYFF